MKNRRKKSESSRKTIPPSQKTKKTKDPLGRAPNRLLYSFAFILTYPMSKLFFRLDYGRKDFTLPKGPFLIVANHSTMLDFLFVMLPFYPRKINAVVTNRYFFSRPLKQILPTMGCIPKNQFEPDVLSIKRIISVIKRGGIILLFPEGRCSNDGTLAGIHTATGKLVKHLGVPVISCYIDGASSCVPHWRKGFRPGRIHVSVSELFSADDTRTLSADEINDAICAKLRGDGKKSYLKPTGPVCERKLAQGLERVLFWCPLCNKEYTTRSKNNEIMCTSCGFRAKLDRHGNLSSLGYGCCSNLVGDAPLCIPRVAEGCAPCLASSKSPLTANAMECTSLHGDFANEKIPKNIHEWYIAQSKHLSSGLSETMAPIIKDVTIQVTTSKPDDALLKNGSGALTLDPKGWTFNGKLDGVDTMLFFPIETVPAIPFEYNGDFLIYAHSNIYRFNSNDNLPGTKTALLGELAHQKFAPKPLLTKGR